MYPYSRPLAVDTAQTLEGISAQILQNQKDLPAAIAANQAAGAAGGIEGASAISGASVPVTRRLKTLMELRLTF
jgi:hypothetical protein